MHSVFIKYTYVYLNQAISEFLKSKRGKWGRYLWCHWGSTLLWQYVTRGAGGGSEKVKSVVMSLMDSP